MLAYAYQSLNLSEYRNIVHEKFENITDLYSEILSLGLPVLIRGGLLKDYITVNDQTAVIRGKIDINSSIKQNTLVDKKLVVTYDELSEDILLNQLLKATLLLLTKSSRIAKKKREKFFSYLAYFGNVSEIRLELSLWKKIQYSRQNIRYQLLIDVCRFLYEELLIAEGGNDIRKSLDDDQRLSKLFEKFVFEFYKKETEYQVVHPQIPWKIDNEFTDALPIMQTDIVLKYRNRTLIIDTKFYTDNMAKRFEGGTAKQKSANLYQMFTYVNNWVPQNKEIVAGMLLYAQTTAEIQPQHHYKINGNSISVLTLNLNQEFEAIHNDLISLAAEILGEKCF